MAKSKETFNKKEKEKKRLKQLQDKRQRAEERKANKKSGTSFEDMLMYPDEFGNLHSTPPDPRFKKTIRQEDIVIGVPKQEYVEEVPLTGTITFYNTDKGFGFITTDQTKEKIFFHVNNTSEPLVESNKVQFRVEPGPRGPVAVEINKLT
jgi:cold shock CspA family protein